MKIEKETHQRLMSIGSKGQTFDKIINNLIDDVEKYAQTKYTN